MESKPREFTSINMDMARDITKATETQAETIEELLKRVEKLIIVYTREAIIEVPELLNKIIEKDPLNAEVVTTLGMSFLYSGKTKESIEVFEKALKIDPTLKRARKFKQNAQKIQQILEETGEIKAATASSSSLAGQMKILEDGLKIDPMNRNVMFKLEYRRIFVFYYQQQYNDALKNINRFVESYPLKFMIITCTISVQDAMRSFRCLMMQAWIFFRQKRELMVKRWL